MLIGFERQPWRFCNIWDWKNGAFNDNDAIWKSLQNSNINGVKIKSTYLEYKHDDLNY
jgi:hypothetical protein